MFGSNDYNISYPTVVDSSLSSQFLNPLDEKHKLLYQCTTAEAACYILLNIRTKNIMIHSLQLHSLRGQKNMFS